MSGDDYDDTLKLAKYTTSSRLFLAIFFSFLTVVGSGSVAAGDLLDAPNSAALIDDVGAEASRVIRSAGSKNELRRLAAVSRSTFGDYTSRFFKNIYVKAGRFPGTKVADEVLEITDPSKYMNNLKKLYADAGNPLNPILEKRILDYISKPERTQDTRRYKFRH